MGVFMVRIAQRAAPKPKDDVDKIPQVEVVTAPDIMSQPEKVRQDGQAFSLESGERFR